MTKYRVTSETSPDVTVENIIEANSEDEARQIARAEYGGYATRVEPVELVGDLADQQQQDEEKRQDEPWGVRSPGSEPTM